MRPVFSFFDGSVLIRVRVEARVGGIDVAFARAAQRGDVTPRHQISQTLASNRVDEGVGSAVGRCRGKRSTHGQADETKCAAASLCCSTNMSVCAAHAGAPHKHTLLLVVSAAPAAPAGRLRLDADDVVGVGLLPPGVFNPAVLLSVTV